MAHKITVTLPQLAKMIDHSLLHPTMTDADLIAGLKIGRDHHVATACVNSYAIPLAKQELAGSDALVHLVIGFPTVLEASAAAKAGGAKIDMVVNVGKVSGGIGILKVIFENDYLQSEHIARLCEICTQIGVAFIKMSTGYGFVKQPDGLYNYKGATVPALKLMREKSGDKV
ncbi:hypothetical protein AbraIFM66951_010832 [Aspergillus brasiliensis]|uniref:Deoxyribose-phosphate aldolase n=1 Tax=Aspergillus brasiliensis TaxID=319629 RepID=A0A9W5YIK7_9EURO|nr:hypothetical protein AbraCBS73388_010081 [Aspergillus brasiliensis]GKZ47465.1 hypothetical protein AbraIFM66951_010832 [Aspergillus brasiliensis]